MAAEETAVSRHSAHFYQLTAEVARADIMVEAVALAVVEQHIHLRIMATEEAEITEEAVAEVSTAKVVTAEHMEVEAAEAAEAILEPEATAEPTVAVEAEVIISLTPRWFLAEQAEFHPAEVAAQVNPGTAAEERIR